MKIHELSIQTKNNNNTKLTFKPTKLSENHMCALKRIDRYYCYEIADQVMGLVRARKHALILNTVWEENKPLLSVALPTIEMSRAQRTT